MKGKPWTREEEKQLREMLQAGKSSGVIAKVLGKTKESIRQKMIKLGWKEQQQVKINCCSSSNDDLLKDLPSVEEALKALNKALTSLDSPGLDKAETLRLRAIIHGAKMYIEKFAEYLNYRELEVRLIELEGKYAALVKKSSKAPAA